MMRNGQPKEVEMEVTLLSDPRRNGICLSEVSDTVFAVNRKLQIVQDKVQALREKLAMVVNQLEDYPRYDDEQDG